jgi:dienelactone hydrolase
MKTLPLPRLSKTALCFALTLCLGSVAHAAPAISSRPEAFVNPSSSGAKTLDSVVWYPTRGGSKALAKKPKGGFPVVVFLHGIGGLAENYAGISKILAGQGYIVVQNNTARFNGIQQRKDGAALFYALNAVNRSKKSFWYKSINMKKVALSGHSMGGGSTVDILAKNPGFAVGFCFAPVSNFSAARSIKVPVGCVMGEGDKYKWKNGENLFNALPKGLKGKFFYLLNAEADHQNLIREKRWGGNKANQEVFKTSMNLALAFFNKHLKGQGKTLAKILKDVKKEPRLKKIYQ